MTHDEAWSRLPDLLDDRDQPELLGHVANCAPCQRQLFLLGRVDRLLRARAEHARPVSRRHRWPYLAGLGAAAALAASLLAVVVPAGSPNRAFTLRTASGQPVGHAVIGRSEGGNVSLALVARGLPPNRQHMFVLWASDTKASMEVGPFMVDNHGGCRARFNLPISHIWRHLWIAEPGDRGHIVASTDTVNA